MTYTYRDFATNKQHYTRGEFLKWQRGGLMNAWYAIFKRPKSDLLIPEYCLTPETKRALPPKPESEPNQ